MTEQYDTRRDLSQNFAVCTICLRLCVNTSNRKCKHCGSDYQRARELVIRSDRTISYAVALEKVQEKGRTNMVGDYCGICGEQLRGYRHDTIAHVGKVCPYDYAEYERLRRLPSRTYRKLLLLVDMSRTEAGEKTVTTVAPVVVPEEAAEEAAEEAGLVEALPEGLSAADTDDDEPDDDEILALRRAKALASVSRLGPPIA